MTHVIIGFVIFATAVVGQIINYAYLRAWRKANAAAIKAAKRSHGPHITVSFKGHSKLHNLFIIGMWAGLIYSAVAIAFYFAK